MAKHLSIKTICVSTFVLLLTIFGDFQNTFGESLSAVYNFGSATSTIPQPVPAPENVISVTVAPSSSTDVLIVATFSMDSVTNPGTKRDATFQLTDGVFSFGTIIRTIDSDDAGIGSIVYIDNGVSVSTTYTLQHYASTEDVKTYANLVAMPLLTDGTSPQTLANSSARVTAPIVIPGATFSTVTGTSITVTTAAPTNGSLGSFYVAASLQSYKTSGGGSTDTGEWQLQYSDDSGSTWGNVGYPIQRSVTGSTDNGIINLVGTLINIDASATDYQFQIAHRHVSGSGTMVTANADVVAVFTGFNDGTNDQIFDTYSTLIPLASTTSTTLERAGGFSFQPAVDTDLFLHVPYYISAKGKTHAIYDLFISGALDSQDQKRALSNAGDRGSGASVGLATGLTAGTIYDVQLRHAQDTTGQTITTNNGDILGWNLNSRILGATSCPTVPPQTPTRTPGPDNCLFYDGTDNFISVPDDASLDLTSPFTIECWVKPDSLGTTQGVIGKGGTAGSQPSIRLNASDQVEVYWNGSLHLTSTTALPSTCQWYHIATTYANPALTIYINGISDGTFNFGTSPTNNASALTIGQTGDANYFNGAIDEVRIWQYAFGTTVLRDWMCKKVTYGDSGHPNWRSGTNNLSAYWRFDENGLGATVYDEISYLFGTNNDGTATNFAFGTERICSSAPIGDESAHDYSGSTFSDFEVALSYTPEYQFSTLHDEMTVTGDAGTWSGLQLYMVDDAPNNNVPPFAWGTGYTLDPNRYWGVFSDNIFSTTPTYKVFYDWTLHQGLTKESWNSLKLASRDGNCDNPWSPLSAILNTTTRTLSIGNQAGTEYILGGNINSDDPLAITLAHFFAEIDESGKCIRVSWETATEIETIGYYLWRSDSESSEYTLLTDSFIPSQAVSETTGASYEYIDCTADLGREVYYYYKLEEVDFDTEKPNPMHGPAGPVSQTVSSVKLSESFNSKNDSKCFINTLLQ